MRVDYHHRQTAFGKSRPNPLAIQGLAGRQRTVFPAGIAATNMLGFTAQSGRRGEVSTSGLSLPRKLIGNDTVIHTRRPAAWTRLSQTDAALLEFLRARAKISELSPEDTVARMLTLIAEDDRFDGPPHPIQRVRS